MSENKMGKGKSYEKGGSTYGIAPSVYFTEGSTGLPSFTGGRMSNVASTDAHASHRDASAKCFAIILNVNCQEGYASI
jgi:hypothetical protein